MFNQDTLNEAKAALDDKQLHVEQVDELDDNSEFDIDEAVGTMQEARERRQEFKEMLYEGLMGLAAKKDWGNKDVELTEEREEMAEQLQDAGIGGKSEEEAKAEMRAAHSCAANGGHNWKRTTIEVAGREAPAVTCQNCPEEKLNL